MRTTKYLLATIKNNPSDAETKSHILMVRSGMIRKLSSGLYTWMPTGLRVLRNLTKIIIKEMNHIGAIEILMPVLQPYDLWGKSKRCKQYGRELLTLKDRNNRNYILSPTNEELITKIIHNEIHSYKQLPFITYQIQTKFRDEIRPQFGVIRSREFIMKDAYSFHQDKSSMNYIYSVMCNSYRNIFNNIGLKVCLLQADSGLIGGSISHEFRAFKTNQKKILKNFNKTNYLYNFLLKNKLINLPKEKLRLINVNDLYLNKGIFKKLNINIKQTIKTIMIKTKINTFVVLIIRGDHKFDYKKIEKLSQIFLPLTFASNKEIKHIVGSDIIGPINLSLPMIIDSSVSVMSDFVAGANIDKNYFFGINWGRDIELPLIMDLKKNTEFNLYNTNNVSDNNSTEVAHIFQLGSKYTKQISATVKNKLGQNIYLMMGCYGIGLTRTIASVIEQNYDEYGIIWPGVLAPFNVAILPINLHKSNLVCNIVNAIYLDLLNLNIDVLLDDRNENIGVMYTDIELIGIPHILVISEKNLKLNQIEYKNRAKNKKTFINVNNIVKFIYKKIYN
ncbi:MAG: proline--tRNA ligase [Enterobacterales bacterium]